MGPATSWAPASPTAKYGLTNGPASPATTELTSVATPRAGAAAAGQPFNPENPLFWFGAIAAVTFGLAAFSTNVRVGSARAGVSLGDPK
jgi:hypothetical protein